MLKGIPSNVSSALLKALADMGHGDTIVIADHFYPAATMETVRWTCSVPFSS